MRPRSAASWKTRLSIALVMFLLLVDLHRCQARRRTRNRHSRQNKMQNFSVGSSRRKSVSPRLRASFPAFRHHKKHAVHTDTISSHQMASSDLFKLVNPVGGYSSGSNNWIGTVRHQRLYCPIGIGFHLEIRKNGRVRARKARQQATDDSVLEIFSVDIGVVGIRSVPHKLYLCMNKSGRLYTSRSFLAECRFWVNLEENNYNTYASTQFSNRRTRKGFYLALKRNGKPRRGRRVSWRQRAAHWLPRDVSNR